MTSKKRTRGRIPKLRGPPISETHPELVLQWDDPNYSPDMLSFGSEFKIQWKCQKCEHQWLTSPNARGTSSGRISGCAVCNAGVLHSDNRNSLQNMYPEIARDFHPDKNLEFTANDIVGGSGRKIWWKCHECEFEWKTSLILALNKEREFVVHVLIF
jgi:hypothetical protein